MDTHVSEGTPAASDEAAATADQRAQAVLRDAKVHATGLLIHTRDFLIPQVAALRRQ